MTAVDAATAAGGRPGSTRPSLAGVPVEVGAALPDFTGRGWVHSALDAWIASGQRALLVLGGPGTGKSLLVGDLVRRHGSAPTGQPPDRTAAALHAVHFCRGSDDTSTLPDRLIGALAGQLSALPGYADALTAAEPTARIDIAGTVSVGGDVGAGARVTAVEVRLVDASPERLFDRVVRAPLERLAGRGALPDPLVLAVDGLDEALTVAEGEFLVSLLARAAGPDGRLPPAVRFLLTSRPDERVTTRLRVATVELGTDSRATADLAGYAHRRLLPVLDHARADRLARRVADAAGGTFLYARYVLDDLLALPARLAEADPEAVPLPAGLAGYYATSLDRELARSSERWEDRYRPLLGALAVARAPGLTPAELTAITGLPRSRVDDGLTRCSPYLVGQGPEPHRIFHQSFADYLADAGPHCVYPEEAHALVAHHLTAAGGERTERDLVWHLAGAGDLAALDRALDPAHVAAAEERSGDAAVIDDLRRAAASAARAGDLPRTLRWSWAAVGRRGYAAEALTPELLPLLARTGGAERALRAAKSLDPGDSEHDRVITELAGILVELGRPGDALALIHDTDWRWGSAAALSTVVIRLARSDPAAAARLARDAPQLAQVPDVCAALAAAGAGFVDTAEELAGADPAALHALAVVVGRTDLDRALALADRVRSRYAAGAGAKVYHSPATVRADLVADRAGTDPAAAAALLHRLVGSGELPRGADRQVAVLATALRLGRVDPEGALSLLELASGETPTGLVLAAVATSGDERMRQLAVRRWRDHGPCVHLTHAADVEVVARLDLAALRATPESRTIAREALRHAADRLLAHEYPFEYVGGGVGALAGAIAAVDPGAAEDVLDEARSALRGTSEANAEAEAVLRLVRALGGTDRDRSFRLAMSASGIYSHYCLVALVEALAGSDLAAALSVVDEVPARYGATRAVLLGTASRHVAIDDADALSRLRGRLPRRGDSDTFRYPFARAGMALAARLVAIDADLAGRVADRYAAACADHPELGHPYPAARAAALAPTDPEAALAQALGIDDDVWRARAVLAVVRAGRYPAGRIRDAVEAVGDRASGYPRATLQTVADLLGELARQDPGLAARTTLELDRMSVLDIAAPALQAAAAERWGADEAVRRLAAAALDVPTDPAQDHFWTVRRRLTGLFSAVSPGRDDALLAALDALDPTMRVSLEPWVVAPRDPDGALLRWAALGNDEVGRPEVITRAGRGGLAAAVGVFRRSPDPSRHDEEALWRAIGHAAAREPAAVRAQLADLDWAGGYEQSQAYRHAAEGAGGSDLATALALVREISDASIEGLALASLASAPGIGPDGGHAGPSLRTLIDLADPLPVEARGTAFTEIARVLAGAGAPEAGTVALLLVRAAARDRQTFDACVPDLVCAACAARPDLAHRFAAELDAAAALVTA